MNMTPYTRLAALFAILSCIAGCKQPADIELTSDTSDENLEVYSVATSDPDIATSPVDSIAVLPEDQTKHFGLFVINSVTWDVGTTPRHVAYSRVLVGDTVARVLGRRVGVRGIDLGTLMLNGTPMAKVPHRIPVDRIFGRDTTIVFGVEYLLDLTRSYRANLPLHMDGNSGDRGVQKREHRHPGVARRHRTTKRSRVLAAPECATSLDRRHRQADNHRQFV